MFEGELRFARSIRDGVLHGTGPDLLLAAEVLEKSDSDWDRYSAAMLRSRVEKYEREVAAQQADQKLAEFRVYGDEWASAALTKLTYVFAGLVLLAATGLIWWFS